jgi:hypothetical protein
MLLLILLVITCHIPFSYCNRLLRGAPLTTDPPRMADRARRWNNFFALRSAVTWATGATVNDAPAEAPSSPLQPEPASVSTAVAVQGAVKGAAAGCVGLPMPTIQQRDEAAPSEFGIESIMFSQVGDSIATSDAGDAASAAGAPREQRVKRQTSPICRTRLREERLEFWKNHLRFKVTPKETSALCSAVAADCHFYPLNATACLCS